MAQHFSALFLENVSLGRGGRGRLMKVRNFWSIHVSCIDHPCNIRSQIMAYYFLYCYCALYCFWTNWQIYNNIYKTFFLFCIYEPLPKHFNAEMYDYHVESLKTKIPTYPPKTFKHGWERASKNIYKCALFKALKLTVYHIWIFFISKL